MRVRSRCKACKRPIDLPTDGSPIPALCRNSGCRLRHRARRGQG